MMINQNHLQLQDLCLQEEFAGSMARVVVEPSRDIESLRVRMGLVINYSLQEQNFQSDAGTIRNNQPPASKESPHDSSTHRRKTIL